MSTTVDGPETEKDMSIVFFHSNRGELGNVLYAGAGTLKCQECGVSCSSGKDVEKHLQGVHNAGVTCYTCRGCGRRFKRLTQVACHFPRCKGRLPDQTPIVLSANTETSGISQDPACSSTQPRGAPSIQPRGQPLVEISGQRNRCEHCNAEFGSQRELSQHLRIKHPNEYQTKLAADDRVKRRGYELAEIRLLAEAEVDLPQSTKFVNIALHDLGVVDRTMEQIRQIRKLESYRSLVEDLKRARSDSDENLMLGELIQAPTLSLCDTLLSFSPVEDQRYRQLLECAVVAHTQGWPQSSVEQLDETLKNLYPSLKTQNKGGRSGVGRSQLQDWRDGNLSSRQRKQIRYRTCQTLWRTDRKRLAKVLLDDASINPRLPAIRHVEQVYQDRYSRPQDLGDLPEVSTVTSRGRPDERSLVGPITPDEVKAELIAIKQRSACEPDSLSVTNLKKVGAPALALIFLCWLLAGRTPRWTKRSRTTLIPKCLERTKDVGNWRLITIGSHLVRLYTKILSQRLQRWAKLNPLQKAFREVEECAEHIALLHGMMRDARKRNRSIFVVLLDLAKAFNSVNHELLAHALQRQGCPEQFIGVVKDLYDGAVIWVSNGSTTTGDIEMQSGVKHGCPLSPLLFNMVMDELVDGLNPVLGYRLPNGSSVSTMAFADDLLLVSESLTGIKSLLSKTETFM